MERVMEKSWNVIEFGFENCVGTLSNSQPNLTFEMPWTTEQKIFIVEAYFRPKSIHAAQLQFKERFGCREFPVHSMIYRWVNKFRTHGTVCNLNCKDTNRQPHSGWPKSSRTPHNIAAVRDRCRQPKQVCGSTINTERYVQVLGKFWTALGRRRGVVRDLQWFQQDGATPHSSNESLAWLQQRFPDWSAAGVTHSGCRIHRTWTPQIFICGDTLRIGCMATTPRLSLTWRQQSQQQ